MDWTIKRIFIILLLALLASGCATTKRMYEGEQLPKEQIAIVMGSSKYMLMVGHLDVYLLYVDGTPCETRRSVGDEVEVLPGWHEIVVKVFRETNCIIFPCELLDYYTLGFYAVPGHKYRVESSFWKTKDALVTVVDTRSGEIVASQLRKALRR